MQNLAQMFKWAAQEYGEHPAFATREGKGEYTFLSYADLYQRARDLASALIDLGVKQKEHVGLFADNRLEWIIADMAIILTGSADVPRGADITGPDIEHIVPHSDMKILFVENLALYKKVTANKKALKGVKKVILIEQKEKAPKGVLHMNDLITKGAASRKKNDKVIDDRIKKIKSSDLFTLIYTSGTTGQPKGVMLTHKNIISQVDRVPIPIDITDRMVSILPVWHIFERMFEMVAMRYGACTYYSNIKRLKEDLKIVKPTFMASAPRLWESVYNGIYNNIEKSGGLKKGMFAIAYFFATHFNRALRFVKRKELAMSPGNPLVTGIRLILELIVLVITFLPFRLFDLIVLKKIRAATGGCLKGSVSGGGALPFHVDLFFNNIGIPVLEGYGLTETSPVLAVRLFDDLVIGTIGPTYPETEIRVVSLENEQIIYPPVKGKKGELHVKGDQVMVGYYKNNEATKKVLSKDGWLNTGDIAMVTFNNCIKLLGRSKDTIVLLGGENLEPVPIENMINQSPYIDNCMLVGQDQKTLSALIVVNTEALKKYGSTVKQIASNEDAKTLIKNELKRLISTENGFKSFEKVIDFAIVPKPFEIGDEMTAKLSIKRHVITEKYADLIKKLYN